MSTHVPKPAATSFPPGARVAVVAARFNAHVVDELLAGCLRRLAEMGLAESSVDVERVPGAFELPVAAKVLARTGRYGAVICLGCVIRGDTPHFDYVAGEAAKGLGQVAAQTGVPVAFGVLTCNTLEQAIDRAGGAHGHAGVWAADAAAEMVDLVSRAARRSGGSR